MSWYKIENKEQINNVYIYFNNLCKNHRNNVKILIKGFVHTIHVGPSNFYLPVRRMSNSETSKFDNLEIYQIMKLGNFHEIEIVLKFEPMNLSISFVYNWPF